MPTRPVNQDQYRTQSATVKDLSNKYGFDYSRNYAARQAETEAQARRDQTQSNLRQVDAGVRQGVQGIDQNYFQQLMNTNQGMANRGMNAGVSQDAQTRLGMSQQAELGQLYTAAQNQRFQLNNDLTRIEDERLAREESLYQQRLAQAFDQIQNMNRFNQAENQAMLQAALQQRQMNIGIDQFDRNLAWDQDRFGQQMDWERHQFNNLSAYQGASLEEQRRARAAAQRQAQQQQDWAKMFQDLMKQGQQSFNQDLSSIVKQNNYTVNPHFRDFMDGPEQAARRNAGLDYRPFF